MDEKDYRQEIKFLLSPVQARLLEQRVRAVMKPDEHNRAEGGYHIRSVYFDTCCDRAYQEKLMGVAAREKYRIRIYNMSPDGARLERKEKRGNMVFKEALPLTRNAVDQAVKGDFSGFLSHDGALAAGVYAMWRAELLRPVVVVDYRRAAYVYPVGNVRVTFDTALSAGRATGDIWSAGCFSDVLAGSIILEIKFNGYLPEHVRQVVGSVPGAKLALSKYVLCRKKLLMGQGDFIGGRQ